MKKLLMFGMAIALSGVWSLTSAQAGQAGRGQQVCLYERVNYQGWEECYGPGAQINDLKGHNRQASSIRLFNRAQVDVFDDKNFKGNAMQITQDIPDLSTHQLPKVAIIPRNWNHTIQSLRVSGTPVSTSTTPIPSTTPVPSTSRAPIPIPSTSPSTSSRDPRNNSGRNEREPRDGACVYERADFQGRSECWSTGNSLPDLTRTRSDWNDRISSIRLFGRATAELYSETRYKGERLTVDRNISDLADIRLGPGQGRGNQGRGNSADRGRGRGNRSWNDQVSSIKVIASRRSSDNRR